MVGGAWNFRGGRAADVLARVVAVESGALGLRGRRAYALVALVGVAVGCGAGILSGGRALEGAARLG